MMHLLIVGVALFPVLLAAAPVESLDEDHLRKRVEAFNQAFETQEFDTALGMYTEKARQRVTPSLPRMSRSPLKYSERLPWLSHAAFFV